MICQIDYKCKSTKNSKKSLKQMFSKVSADKCKGSQPIEHGGCNISKIYSYFSTYCQSMQISDAAVVTFLHKFGIKLFSKNETKTQNYIQWGYCKPCLSLLQVNLCLIYTGLYFLYHGTCPWWHLPKLANFY